MKKIVSLAVSYPVSIFMMVLAVLLLGSISFQRLGVELVPELKNPTLFVELKAGIKPPSEVETQFIESIESIAIRQNGAIEVSSISQTGYGRVTVTYDWGKDMDEAFLDLQKSLSAFSLNDEIDEFAISQFDPNAAPVMILGIYNPASNDTEALRRVAEHNFKNELIKLPGIAEVRLAGAQEKEVVIETDPDLLASFGLTVNDLVGKIQNYNRSVSGGFIEELGRKYVIKGLGIIENPDDLEDLVVGHTSRQNTTADPAVAAVASPGNQASVSDQVPVVLREVATVKLLNKEATSIVRVNQQRSIGMSIYKETNYNTVNAVNELTAVLERLKTTVPGYEFVIIQNQGRFIQDAIDEVKQSGLYGALFAILVLFVFLRRIGSTIIVSLAIPISIIATFNLMYFNGLTLNVMTLGGLALGAGMLVDNAIVVVENIFRKREEGLSVPDAAIEGTSEVGGAITASTLTTIVVFLPIVYLQGASGELFKDQAWTVAFSLIASLVVAILVIPMLFTQVFRKDKVARNEKPANLKVDVTRYRSLLEKVLRRKTAFILASFALILLACLLVPVIGSEYMPQAGTRAISVDIALNNGTPLSRTSATVNQIEGQLLQLFEGQLDKVYSHIGAQQSQSGMTNENVYHENRANLKLIFGERTELDIASVTAKLSDYFEAIPGLEATFSNDESALNAVVGEDQMPLVVEVSGPDFTKLGPLSDSVMIAIAGNEDVYDPVSSLEEGVPQIQVDVDKYRAGLLNLSIDDVILQIKDQLEGKQAGTIEQGGEMQAIKIKVPEMSLAGLRNMMITGGQRDIPLSEIADVTVENASNSIHRKNQTRTVSIGARVNQDESYDKVVKSIEKDFADLSVPPQYKIRVAGQELKRQESTENLTFALLLSILLVYMVLASQFESLLHPFTILLTIPLAGVGAIFAFFILGMPLSMMAFIGLILLAGIAVNNSVILVDSINNNKLSGMSIRESILDAAQRRFRPILMTSLTTILGLLPLTVGFGESAALRAPMAIAVIGGLTTSTLLTLIIIPCYYESIENIANRITGRKSAKIQTSHG